MIRSDLNTIEFYDGYGDELITTVQSAAIPRQRETVRIGGKLYTVMCIDNVVDYSDFPSAEMRVCVSLKDSCIRVHGDVARAPKGLDDLVHITWNK